MCGPVSPMMMLSIAGSAFQFIQGQQQAKDQARANRANLKATYIQNEELRKQNNEKAALESHERMKQGMIDRGEAKTIAGESNALGFSSQRMLADSAMNEGLDLMSIEKNRVNSNKNIDYKNTQEKNKAQSSTNSAYNQAPSLIGTGLQIAGDIYTYKNKTESESKGS
jgi:hypothetical protein